MICTNESAPLCEYFPVIESRDQVEDIYPLANQDKHEGELISPVNLLDVDLKAAADIEEPDQTGAGVVDQALDLGDQVHGRHEETFLKYDRIETRPGQHSSTLPPDFSTLVRDHIADTQNAPSIFHTARLSYCLNAAWSTRCR